MAYKVTLTKEESRLQLETLVEAFAAQFPVYSKTTYNEAQLRVDFISPFLKTFGWDIDNEAGKTQFLRDVIQEEAIEVAEADAVAKKNPDYTMRNQGNRKFFVEAKKVAVDIEHSVKSAFQARRYGWSANLGITILTNFDKLVVYDCRYQPNSTDEPAVARYKVFHYINFLANFEELYDLLSFASVSAGYLDEYFSLNHPDLTTFDHVFLKQIEKWRLQLAANIIAGSPNMSEETINILVQRLLNRIVFLRICEDRDIEKYETLRQVKDYAGLKAIFVSSDKKYNSGLFDFIEDNLSLQINLDAAILVGIFNELYYPESPYDFSVVDPAILGQIYERYLGSRIAITAPGQITLVEEPEVAASSGVVPTPKLVVRHIIRETLEPLFEGKTLKEIQALKIADICCGSGTFLIALYDYLLEKITLALIASGEPDPELLALDRTGAHSLTLKGRHAVLLHHIYGVDINPYAVEVTKFSLFLKLLENENSGSVNHFLANHGKKVLPSLDGHIKTGNSLVDESYFTFDLTAINNDELLYKVKPFNWSNEFPFLMESGGFDAIIGNPPYVRIQHMAKYLAEEIKFYQHPTAGYTVAQSDTFDKYYLFIQRAVHLLKPEGRLGYIIPNKFFIVKGGRALRRFITTSSELSKIIHFGVTQIFPNRSTYTAVLVLGPTGNDQFKFKRIKHLAKELFGGNTNYRAYDKANFSGEPWIFLADETQEVFDKLYAAGTVQLNTIAEITVGLQTSADKIYIFQTTAETDTTYRFRKGNVDFEVEKAICKPCLYDLSFGLFDTVKANAQMIFPYTVTDKAEVFTEAYFQANYPLAWAYLNGYQETLSKRSINGSKEPKWYQYGRSQSLTKFHANDKLIWPVLSKEASYILDEANLQFTGGGNGPYYCLLSRTDYSPLYFLAILAHPLFEAMVKSGASEFRGAYYSHGKQFIERLPIKAINFAEPAELKLHNDIVAVVKQIIAAKRTYQDAENSAKSTVLARKLAFLETGLVEQINQLYGITAADIRTALSDQIFITDFEE
ncbi:Eco57I restriction-modification methylase domain-containing protein [Mucilaginibacter mali]|uniref:site-specific DNA-methyltransferase (adenine-specific) n=1 Tax=Mucilaginibacter mali TaxID=2740462 RepID=A0A7D4QBP5_9SPHI|nr:N-6 DNA methylase [Mucilaginibacter mali]QKJ32871.1 Eco57I restriction-modification methylase domain-containing protein [Mucilaginibacter mali]